MKAHIIHDTTGLYSPLIHTMKSLGTGSWLRQVLCLGFFALLSHSVCLGASANVNIVDFAFDPNNVTINVNDQVVWTWLGDFHSSTSDTGLWDSGVFNTGHVFTNTFTSAGSFPYLCTVHLFTGTVNVNSNNVLTVAITSPTNGASFTAPAIIPITATASD